MTSNSTNDFPAFLSSLFDLTKTPPGDEYSFLANLEVQTRLISFLCRPSRMKSESLSDDNITSFIDFILRVVDTPSSLRGILKGEVPVKLVLLKAFKLRGLTFSETKFWFGIIRHWYSILRNSPDTKKYNLNPHIKDAVIFRYHADSMRSSLYSTKIYNSLYKAYGFTMHLALRFKQSQPAQMSTFDNYALIARDFFTYIPSNIKAIKLHPDDIPPQYYEAFMRGYDILEFANYDGKLTPAAKRKGNCLKRLTGFKLVVPHLIAHPHRGSKKRRRPRSISSSTQDILNIYPPDNYDTAKDESTLMPRINMDFLTPLPSDLESEDPDIDIESAAHEAPLKIPIFTAQGKDTTRKPYLKREWMEAINLRSFKFNWSAQFLQLFHYAIIHQRLRMLWGTNDYLDAIIAFLYLLIHTGIDEHYLIHLTINSTDINDKPAICRYGTRYYIVIPSLVQMSSPVPDICLPKSDAVWIPLPDPINKIFEILLLSRNNRVFNFIDKGKWIQLSLFDIDKFLETHINNCCKYHPFIVNRSIICNSFLPLYHHQFGMDPLVATLIAGRDHHHLFRSQIHYTYIEHTSLEKEYLGTFALVLDAISSTLSKVTSTNFTKLVPGGK